jgi:type VI protein secretion system component Hcp
MFRIVLKCLAALALVSAITVTTAAEAGSRTHGTFYFTKHVDKGTP